MKMLGRLRALVKLALRRLRAVASFCRACGREVRDFDAPDAVWARVQPRIPFGGNTLCYECFADIAREVGLRLTTWRLVPVPDERTHLDEFIGALNAPAPTDAFRFCNHHHELTPDHELVDFGDGPFVANRAAIPLLKALNDMGLRTRTHHVDGPGYGFVSILLDDHVSIEVKTVNESDADRTKYNGMKELLIMWQAAGS